MKSNRLIKAEELSMDALQRIVGGAKGGAEAGKWLGFKCCCNDTVLVPSDPDEDPDEETTTKK